MFSADKLARSIHQKDFVGFSKFFEDGTTLLGYTVEWYFNFITKHLNLDLYQNVEIFTQLLPLKNNQYILQIFFNEILILEENILVDLNSNLIKGLTHTTDCFGKLAIFNDRIDRILTIRPKRGSILKDIFFIDEDLDEPLSIAKGNLFDDGYYAGYFKLTDDTFHTKTTKIKIITDKGIESQQIVLRGIDYPFFNINKPIIEYNKVILTENLKKLYRLLVIFDDGTEYELLQGDFKESILNFDKKVVKVYQSINGCAMNYFINKSC
jgi:hypothetical protein